LADSLLGLIHHGLVNANLPYQKKLAEQEQYNQAAQAGQDKKLNSIHGVYG
jgi:hypothetical protein